MPPTNVGPASSRHSVESASGDLRSRIPCRVIFIFMGFFCFFNLYSMRVNLGVTLGSLLNHTYLRHEEQQSRLNTILELDPAACNDDNNTRAAPRDGSFNWNSKQQYYINSCFYAGYAATQLAGGMLAEMFGGKVVLFTGITWSSLLTLLSPVIVEAGGFPAVMIMRFCIGFAQGFVFPAMHVMLAVWSPPLERGRTATFIYSGSSVGAVVSYSVSGALCSSVNWQSAFYVFGGIGLVWSVMWIFLVYDRPSEHPRITTEERMYIENSLGRQQNRAEMKRPWLEIITSPAVHALVIANFAFNWGNFYLITCMPSFLSNILKFNAKQSAFVASTPFMGMFFGMVLSGVLVDLLLARRLASVTGLRKLLVLFGFLVPAAGMISIGFVDCENEVAVFLLVISGFCLGISWSGWEVNHLDLAPMFAGTLFGISLTFGSIPGFVAPLIVSTLTDKRHTHAAWRETFFISAGGLAFGAVVFLIFGSGKLQKWSNPEPKPSVTAPRDSASSQSTRTVRRSSAEASRRNSAKQTLNTAV